MRLCEALLLQRNVAESPPGVIVRLVGLQRGLIALFTVLVVLVGNELVAAEGVRVGEVLVELDRASEELQCRLVLFQQAVAVANDAPSFRCEERFLYSLVTKENKGRLVLQVPEACRVVLQAFESMRLQLTHLFVNFDCLVEAALFKDALGELALYPAGFPLPSRELSLVDLLSLFAVELAL